MNIEIQEEADSSIGRTFYQENFSKSVLDWLPEWSVEESPLQPDNHGGINKLANTKVLLFAHSETYNLKTGSIRNLTVGGDPRQGMNLQQNFTN